MREEREKSDLIAVTGNVTKEFFERNDGTRDVSRTIIAEDVLATRGSVQPKVPHPTEVDPGLKSAVSAAADALRPPATADPADDEPLD